MRFRTLGICAAIVLSGLLLEKPAAAQDWNVVLNGKAIHVNSSKKWNEDNWGVGIEREFDDHARWVKVALANGFLDSDSQMSYMAGGGIKRRFRLRALSSQAYVDLGAVGFLMTRQDVNNDKPFPGVLPALTIGTRDFAVNMTYMPAAIADRFTHVREADPTISGILFIQFKLSPSMFGFGARQAATLASR